MGIPSRELAKTLAKICLFHDPPNGERATMLNGELVRTVIDPFGEIREPFLATLLTLADTMDGTYTRILPLYLANPKELGIVAVFRQVIRGVRLDAAAGMIRTVLMPDRADNLLIGTYALEMGSGAVDEFKEEGAKAIKQALKNRTSRPLPLLTNVLKALDSSKYTNFSIRNSLGKPTSEDEHRMLHWLLARDVIRVVPVDSAQPKAKKEDVSRAKLKDLPANTPTAIVLGNLHENCQTLNEIQGALAASGVHLVAWLMDDRERLYTHQYEQTYEPVLSKEFLHRVVNAMWEVSTQVFGVSQFSYTDLASQVCEPNTDRVELAVRRIAVAARKHSPVADSQKQEPIWTGPSRWQWRVERADDPPRCHCKFLKDINDSISKLKPPHSWPSD